MEAKATDKCTVSYCIAYCQVDAIPRLQATLTVSGSPASRILGTQATSFPRVFNVLQIVRLHCLCCVGGFSIRAMSLAAAIQTLQFSNRSHAELHAATRSPEIQIKSTEAWKRALKLGLTAGQKATCSYLQPAKAQMSSSLAASC